MLSNDVDFTNFGKLHKQIDSLLGRHSNASVLYYAGTGTLITMNARLDQHLLF